MAGLTNQAASELALYASGIAGVFGTAPTPVSQIPGTPFVTVGAPKVVITGGSWETLEYDFPMLYLIERIADEALDQTAINDALDLVIAYFRSGITLGGIVVSALLLSADTDKFFKLGASDYHGIEFRVGVTVMAGQTYTP